MRKQFCAYTKGLPGAAGLRNLLVRATTLQEYRTILNESGALAPEAPV
jgi:hypothetical protein